MVATSKLVPRNEGKSRKASLPLKSKARYSPVSCPVGCESIHEGSIGTLVSFCWRPSVICLERLAEILVSFSLGIWNSSTSSFIALIWSSEPWISLIAKIDFRPIIKLRKSSNREKAMRLETRNGKILNTRTWKLLLGWHGVTVVISQFSLQGSVFKEAVGETCNHLNTVKTCFLNELTVVHHDTNTKLLYEWL